MGLFDDIFAGEDGLAKSLTDTLSGVTGTLTTKTPAGYDPATDTHSLGSEESISVSATPLQEFTIDEVDGTNIIQGDVFTEVPASDVTVTITPMLTTYTSNSLTFTVVSSKPLYSGDSIAQYKLQLRQ